MSNIEILEMGEDGAFEVPSPSRASRRTTASDHSDMIVPSSEDIDRVLNEINSKSVFDAMGEQEYRVYKDGQQVKVVVKLSAGLRPASVAWKAGNEVDIKLNEPEGKSLGLSLGAEMGLVDATSVNSRYVDGILVIVGDLKK